MFVFSIFFVGLSNFKYYLLCHTIITLPNSALEQSAVIALLILEKISKMGIRFIIFIIEQVCYNYL